MQTKLLQMLRRRWLSLELPGAGAECVLVDQACSVSRQPRPDQQEQPITDATEGGSGVVHGRSGHIRGAQSAVRSIISITTLLCVAAHVSLLKPGSCC